MSTSFKKIIPQLVFICLGLASTLARADSTIVILRHGEKPALGLGQLTCKGLNRSLALAPLLQARYGNPVVVYAPDPSKEKTDSGKPYPYVRPLATIEPLAIRTGLAVNIRWAMEDIEPLAQQILSAPSGTQAIAWEHHWGEALARLILKKLGANPEDVPSWNNEDYDSIYVIRTTEIAGQPKKATFQLEKQNLNALSAACPG